MNFDDMKPAQEITASQPTLLCATKPLLVVMTSRVAEHMSSGKGPEGHFRHMLDGMLFFVRPWEVFA